MKASPWLRLLAPAFLLTSTAFAADPVLLGAIDPSPGPEPSQAELRLYDPVTNRIFGFGFGPTATQGQRVVAIDATTNLVVGAYQVPQQYNVDLALDSAGGKLYVSDYGKEYNPETASRIHVLSTSTLAELAAFELPWQGATHLAVHPGAQKAYAQRFNGEIVEVDLTNGATQTFIFPKDDDGNLAVNPQKNRLYFHVKGVNNAMVYVYDTSTRSYVATVNLPVTMDFRQVVVSASGDRFFIVGETHSGTTLGQMIPVDATTNTAGPMVTIGQQLDFAWHDGASDTLFVSGDQSPLDGFKHVWKIALGNNNQVTHLAQYEVTNAAKSPFVYVAGTQTIHATGNRLPQIYTLNVSTLASGGYDIGYRPYAVAVDPATNRVYSADSISGNLVVADGATRTVVARIPVGATFGRRPNTSIAVNSSTQRVYAAGGVPRGQFSNAYDTTVAVIDSAANQAIATITLQDNDRSGMGATLAVDESADLAFATYTRTIDDGGGNTHPEYKLAVIDGRPASATKDTVLKTLTLPQPVYAMAFNPKNKRLYLAAPSNTSKGFMMLDTTSILTSNPTVGEFLAGYNSPGQVAINPVTNRVYVTDYDSLQLYIFDAATASKLGSISINTPQNPYDAGVWGVAVDSTTNRIYVGDRGNYLQGTLTAIDGATNTVTTTAIEVGKGPQNFAVNEATHQVFIANNDSGDIAVLDDAPPPSITTSVFPLKGGTLAVANAQGPVTFAVVGQGGMLTNELPTGQTLLADGTVSGAAEPGTFTFTIRVTETGNPARFAERSYSVTVPGRPNPVQISVRQVDGSELEQGKLLILEWTLTNTATTNARNVVFRIEPPIGFALQGAPNAPQFFDANGQGTGAPIDPITKKQVTIPGSKSNPLLGFGPDGFQLATYGVGTLLPGATQKVRATFRIAYDWQQSPYIFNFATVTAGMKPGQYPPRQMPPLNLQIAQAPTDAPRPKIGVAVTQLGAGFAVQNGHEVVTVAPGGMVIQGSSPRRRQNEIIYRATYHNEGNQTADYLRISVPVPDNTRYIANTATIDDVSIKPRQEKIGSHVNLVFDVPGLPPNGRKTALFKVALKPGVKSGEEVKQQGALVLSFELLQPTVKLQDRIVRVVNASVMKGLASGDDADYTQPSRIVRDKLFFYNAGGLDSANPYALYKIPAGMIYDDAYLADLASQKIGDSQKAGNTAITVANGEVKFLLGRKVRGKAGLHVPSGAGGFAVVKLKVDPNPANRPAHRSPGEWRAFDWKGQFVPDPAAKTTLAVRARRLRETVATAAPTDAAVVSHLHRSTQDAKTFVMVDAPAFARPGQDVTVKLTWGRCADAEPHDPEFIDQLYYELPPGFTFKSATQTSSLGVTGEANYFTDRSDGQAPGPVGLVGWNANLDPSSVRCASIVLTATGQPGVSYESGFIVYNGTGGPLFAPKHSIRVLKPEEKPGDLSTINFNLYDILLGDGAAASVGSATRPSATFASAAAQLRETDRHVTVTGVDFVQAVGPNVVVIPIGANRLVAAGAGNLISESGSTMVAAGAGNLVAAGAGNLISLTFAPGDNRTGSSVLANIPSLVAAGGMNLVAAGAGNLIGTDGSTLIGTDGATLIGLDGATLVGNDGASLIGTDGSTLQYQAPTVIGSFRFPTAGTPQFLATGVALDLPFTGANMVAAGAGNMVAAGGGHVLAVGSRGNLIGTDGATLIGTDGATLIGTDGATLIGTDGSTLARTPPNLSLTEANGGFLIGTDGATAIPPDFNLSEAIDRAALIGTDGATLTLPLKGMLLQGASGQVVPTGGGN